MLVILGILLFVSTCKYCIVCDDNGLLFCILVCLILNGNCLCCTIKDIIDIVRTIKLGNIDGLTCYLTITCTTECLIDITIEDNSYCKEVRTFRITPCLADRRWRSGRRRRSPDPAPRPRGRGGARQATRADGRTKSGRGREAPTSRRRRR